MNVEVSLTDFLLARIAEDEAAVRPNICTPQRVVDRMLADCEAKRAAIQWEADRQIGWEASFVDAGFYVALRDSLDTKFLRIMAAVYADHPDYREEWRP